MELTLDYFLSQVFIILYFVSLIPTYYVKNRMTMLVISFLGLLACALSYVCLNAWVGFAMTLVSTIRNVIFFIDESKNGKKENITTKDTMILIALCLISIIFCVITFDGFFSLFSLLATILYTFSVWQKKSIVYKGLGIPVFTLHIIYNIYIKSFAGVILEFILLGNSILGFILEIKKDYK